MNFGYLQSLSGALFFSVFIPFDISYMERDVEINFYLCKSLELMAVCFGPLGTSVLWHWHWAGPMGAICTHCPPEHVREVREAGWFYAGTVSYE